MATLPTSSTGISENVQFEDQPTLTFYVDPISKKIKGTAQNFDVMQQAIEIMLSVERYKWQIYTSNFGMEFDGLIGEDPGYVASELQRRISDALSIDNRIIGIEDFEYTVDDGVLTATLTVRTVYGNVDQQVEVVMQ